MKKYLALLLLFTGLLFPQLTFSQADNITDSDGLKQGYWEKKDKNGRIIYKGQFKDDKPYGKFKYYDKDGVIETILEYSHPDTAEATFFHNNGKKAAHGYFVKQKKEGVWRFYDRQGIIASKEEYKNGVKHGKYIVYNLNGTVSRETQFVEGVENGYRKTYNSDGVLLSEGSIVDGQMDGEQIIYRNGIINIKGSYKHAVQDGEWIYYDADGKPYRTEYYELGYKKED